MKNAARIILTVLLAAAFAVSLVSCEKKDTSGVDTEKSTVAVKSEEAEMPDETPTTAEPLADGTYKAEFHTDSTMFHVNEANEGLGILTVKDGQMTIHVSLVSKTILNLYVGLAEDAQKDGAVLLEPTVDTVTYEDGETEEVYGFDIPVGEIGKEFDLAIIGTKGKWYDHKVSVENPIPEN